MSKIATLITHKNSLSSTIITQILDDYNAVRSAYVSQGTQGSLRALVSGTITTRAPDDYRAKNRFRVLRALRAVFLPLPLYLKSQK